MQKTNKKTIIFQSIETKAFCDALIQAESKKTGISIMRLIENALIDKFGFENRKLNEWCCSYGTNSASTEYMSLLPLIKENSGVFALYKAVCTHANIPLSNNNVMQHNIIQNIGDQANANDVNVSDEKAIERIFNQCDRKELDKVFYDFVYENSKTLDAHEIPMDDMVTLLINIVKKG